MKDAIHITPCLVDRHLPDTGARGIGIDEAGALCYEFCVVALFIETLVPVDEIGRSGRESTLKFFSMISFLYLYVG